MSKQMNSRCPICNRRIKVNDAGLFFAHCETKPTRKIITNPCKGSLKSHLNNETSQERIDREQNKWEKQREQIIKTRKQTLGEKIKSKGYVTE